MKNAIIILFAFIITSCAKKYDWTCTCEVSGSSNYNGTVTRDSGKVTEADADYDCRNYGEELAGSNGTYKCSISKK